MKKTGTKKIPLYWKIIILLVFITIILNTIAFSKKFCDWYSDYIYPLLNSFIGTLTSWCPFAIGEIIMYIGALMVIILLISAILFCFLSKKPGYQKYMSIYSKVCLFTIVCFLFSYTINWFIPFRGNVLQVSNNTRCEYTLEEVEYVRNMIVLDLNNVALEAKRDAEGNLVYDYNQQEIAALMSSRADTYSRLSGHYSNLKPALCSSFLHWMHIGGYNYIYTMEPTYNIFCDELYMPTLYCHELCHHKGYYLENEAEFLSTIILSESDNPIFRYSAYVEMYGYMNDAYLTALFDAYTTDGELTEDELICIYATLENQPQLSQLVYDDLNYAYTKKQEKYEENKNEFLEENFQPISEEVADTGWEVQGNILKENTYDGITLMLLQYYISE